MLQKGDRCLAGGHSSTGTGVFGANVCDVDEAQLKPVAEIQR